MTSGQVIAKLERVRNRVGLPLPITCDNSSQFTSRRMDAWTYENDVRLDFIRPLPGRMSEHELVSVPGRCERENRNLANGV